MYKNKIFIILLILLTAVFIMTACHIEPAAEIEKPESVKPEIAEEPEEPEPLPEEPEVVVITGKAAFDNVDVLLGRLDRGTNVHIVGENAVNNSFYDIVFDYEGVSRSGKIEKWLVRPAGEETPVPAAEEELPEETLPEETPEETPPEDREPAEPPLNSDSASPLIS